MYNIPLLCCIFRDTSLYTNRVSYVTGLTIILLLYKRLIILLFIAFYRYQAETY